ncbi:MAG: hypothetical protein ACFE0Q_12665 [Anaerolineae bacterium]
MILCAVPTLAQDITEPVMQLAQDRDASRLVIQVTVLILSIITLWGVARVMMSVARHPGWITWRATFKRIGWILPLITLALIGSLIVFPRLLGSEISHDYAVQTVIPVMMAIQMAGIFAPDDEPALEIQMAAERPLLWLIVERIFITMLIYSLVAGLGFIALYLAHGVFDWRLLLIWIPPALFLSGLTLRITMSLRLPQFGMLMGMVLWVMFALFGNDFIAAAEGYPFPLDVIQSHLWAVHIHANLDTFDVISDFWLNRALLLVAGVSLLMYAANVVRDEEKLLLKRSARDRKKDLMSIPQASGLRLGPVTIRIRPLQQILGIIRYEFLMHWRRRALKVFMLTLLLGSGFILLVLANQTMGIIPNADPMATSDTRQIIIQGLTLVMFSAPFVLVMVLYLFPLLISDVIALDEQHGIDELLGAMPQSGWVYIAGKVGGAWLVGLTAVILSQMILGIGWYFRAGTYDATLFVQLVLLILVLILINGILGVLIGSTQPTRLRAGLAVLAYILITTFIHIRFQVNWIQVLFPSQTDLFIYIMDAIIESLIKLPITMPEIGLTTPLIREIIIGSLLQISVIILLMTLWHQVGHRIHTASLRKKATQTPPVNMEANV